MRKISYILIGLLMVLLGVFFLVETWSSICVHFKTFTGKAGKAGHYWWFLWVLLGAVIFPLINRVLEKNMDFIKTFSHEFSHTVVSVLTLQRVHSFHAEEKTGEITHSGNTRLGFMISLAPYCFMFFTFPLMALRCLVEPGFLPIMDVIIGFTIGLHAVCFKEDTGNYQTDITRHPLAFSYIYIFAILLFDLSLILMSYEPQSNIFYAFKDYAVHLWGYVSMLWS